MITVRSYHTPELWLAEAAGIHLHGGSFESSGNMLSAFSSRTALKHAA